MDISIDHHKNSIQEHAFLENAQAFELAPLSIFEARKIIGLAGDVLSDSELENLIYDLTLIARNYIKSVPKY